MKTFEEAAMPIRSRICKFNTISLFGELISYLQQTPNMKKAGEISAPWVVLLAIDWVLELHPKSGKQTASQKDVQYILNGIWRTQHIAVGVDTSPLSVQIRALLAPQVIFQNNSRDLTYSFLRIKKIIDAAPSNSKKFRNAFKKRYELELEEFYELAFLLCIYCMTEKTKLIDFSTLASNFTPHYSLECISKVINILSKTITEFVDEASSEPDRLVADNEYFKESIFLNSPFLLTDKGLLVIHPTMVMIGISESLVRCFIRENSNNRNIFTRCFEEYIDQIHKELSVSAIREDRLRKFYAKSGNSDRLVVDFLVQETGASIFIDAKGVDPTNPVLSATSRYRISRRINDQHLKAIRQIIDTVDVLSSNGFENIECIDDRYGLVVTHQEFFLGTGERILSFLSEKLSTELETLAKDLIYFRNIHFLTIEQYEKLLCITNESEHSIAEFLKYVSNCESDSKTMKMIMEQYIESFCIEVCGLNLPNGCSSILAEKETIFESSLTVLNHNRDYWRMIGSKGGDNGIMHFLKCRKNLIQNTYLKKVMA